MRRRSRVRYFGVLPVALVACAMALYLGAGTHGAATPQLSRYQLAMQSKQSEDQRIASATEAFRSALSKAPDTPANYLVSLEAPVVISTLLAQTSEAGMSLQTVYTWDWDGHSLAPTIGTYDDAPGFDLDSSAGAADVITANEIGALTRHLESLRSALHSEDGAGSADSLRQQVAETREELAVLTASGAQVYGFACVCSPTSLESLAKTVPGFELRAVESAGSFDRPIAVADPLREATLAEEGAGNA